VDSARRTPVLVYAADEKRVFRADRSVDRRLGDMAMREIGEEWASDPQPSASVEFAAKCFVAPQQVRGQ